MIVLEKYDQFTLKR